MIALARYLEELKMYVSHYRQLDTEIARIAASDNDVQLLMTIPGINCFTSSKKGDILDNMGNYTQAIQYYDKALAIDPKYTDVLNGKGNALDSLDNYTQAIQYYDNPPYNYRTTR